jgi:hypothetical protein
MENKPSNPLSKHFRRPVIYFKLPSGGKFWPEGALNLPVNGEIPVYPMTTADEVTLKTPDALMNGMGVVSVIQSCCPNIVDAWKTPSIDVDAILVAIRIASYGQNMTIGSKCPNCAEEHDYDIELSGILGQVGMPDYSTPVEYDGLKIKLCPQEYFVVNKNNIINFEEQRMLETLNNAELDEEVKAAKLSESMKNLLAANNALMAKSTEYIELEDGTRVTEQTHIKEFYQNVESKVNKLIEERLAQIAKDGALPPIKLQCTNCQHQYDIPLEFDYARFFGQSS